MTSRAARSLALLALAASAMAASGQEMPSRRLEASEVQWSMRAPYGSATAAVALPEAKVASASQAGGTRVGSVRDVAKTSAASWTAVEGGWVARFAVASEGALGLRAKLALPEGLVDARIVAFGVTGAVEGFAPSGTEAWTPWTAGDRQQVEVFARQRPAGLPAVESIVHFEVPLTGKVAAGACSPDVACGSGDAARDAAIAERRNSVMLVNFVEGTEARACTGTLLNTEKYPTAFVLTANHCIATAAAAASVTTLWFYEADSCGGSAANPAQKQVAGGATFVHSSYGADSTLIQLKGVPPSGAVYSGWNAARLAAGDEIVSISHPQGGFKKYALGAEKAELLVKGYPQEMYGVAFTKGVTEGGSSGSGVFTLAGGSLQLRGVLSGSTLRSGAALSCTNAEVEDALYGRFEIFHPQIAGYIAATPPVRTDDYGNRITEAQRIFPVAQAIPSEVTYPGRLDYAGDVDVFRVDVASAGGTLTLRTTGGLDTIGTLMDSVGHTLKSVNDAESDHLDFGMTRTLATGTYYLAVTHREARGTGAYTLAASLSTVIENYTDLWWNSKEPGWGLALNHQGQTLFATLFTYDRDGRPMWLVASSITRQPQGYWEGSLLRGKGPPFNASPWVPATLEKVGTINLEFTGLTKGTLSYSFDGVRVSESIERQRYSIAPVCGWSAFDRSLTTNFQDLWWNPSEPGWGMNIAHQGNILFATLFTYDESGRDLWLVMSKGERIGDGLYIGELLEVEGPPFNAVPWRDVTAKPVGTLSVQFTRGNAATITYTYNGNLVVKRIERQVFGVPATECRAPGDD